MIAYNRQQLDNLEVLREADLAFRKELITSEELAAIQQQHRLNIYKPNFFIRVGLVITTVFIVVALFCLVGLALDISDESTFTVMCFFWALFCYVALELIIYSRHHFESGVDDALLWLSGAFFYVMILETGNWDTDSTASFMTLLLTGTVLAVRFFSAGMATAAFIGLTGIFYNAGINIGAPLLIPFTLIAVSAGVYILSQQALSNPSAKYHTMPLEMLCILALGVAYASGNYFMVKESGIVADVPLPMMIFCWIWTIAIPILYIYQGIRSKDMLILRTGLILVAAGAFTIRYYYEVMATEVIMILAGSVLILIARIITRYLRQPRHGFTAEAPEDNDEMTGNIEALIVAETFHDTPQKPDDGFKFGGGSGMGGGASGNF